MRQESTAAPRVVEAPTDLEEALTASPAADERFHGLADSHKKEYVDWIEGAKKPETRARRIEKAVTMLLHGERLKS